MTDKKKGKISPANIRKQITKKGNVRSETVTGDIVPGNVDNQTCDCVQVAIYGHEDYCANH